ncbi:MAG: hypothetical protein WCF90_02950, partial [Methanomicrobiales archaeon]
PDLHFRTLFQVLPLLPPSRFSVPTNAAGSRVLLPSLSLSVPDSISWCRVTSALLLLYLAIFIGYIATNRRIVKKFGSDCPFNL